MYCTVISTNFTTAPIYIHISNHNHIHTPYYNHTPIITDIILIYPLTLHILQLYTPTYCTLSRYISYPYNITSISILILHTHTPYPYTLTFYNNYFNKYSYSIYIPMYGKYIHIILISISILYIIFMYTSIYYLISIHTSVILIPQLYTHTYCTVSTCISYQYSYLNIYTSTSIV